MWKEGTFKLIAINEPIINEFVDVFKNLYTNGGVIVSCFEVNNHQVFQELPWWDPDKYNTYIKNLLTSTDIINGIPKLNISRKIENNIELKYINSLILDGEFAIKIIKGGAYLKFKGSPQEAKRLGDEFCKCLFQDRFLDIHVFYSDNSWTKWFYDVHWDSTWIIFDGKENKLWLICMTDTD
ncbi:hypothetical protein [Bacillus toyonensis]|uniref:Group-specific protein n=1 Tax=Bacillus toyonensis TaxID=155322 RepID=A0A2A8H4F6_9BACI|nr:hypothetical protein [Bacillus toyonensis]PEP87618.1 hypothetical protein CN585_29725 [Bacillus toyonensis]